MENQTMDVDKVVLLDRVWCFDIDKFAILFLILL